jgi:hypothetical protein
VSALLPNHLSQRTARDGSATGYIRPIVLKNSAESQ